MGIFASVFTSIRFQPFKVEIIWSEADYNSLKLRVTPMHLPDVHERVSVT